MIAANDQGKKIPIVSTQSSPPRVLHCTFTPWDAVPLYS